MISDINEFINTIESAGVEVVKMPSDLDMDNLYSTKLGIEEALVYRRINSIANANVNNVNWCIAIKYLSEDVCFISKLIKDKNIKYPEKLKKFIENCCAIYAYWDDIYREDYHHNRKVKSIDDMDADELREYIRTHNIK